MSINIKLFWNITKNDIEIKKLLQNYEKKKEKTGKR